MTDKRKFVGCYDCKMDYDDFPCDMTMHDNLWEMINPTEDKGGGLLCPNCICKRLMDLDIGLTHIPISLDIRDLLWKIDSLK